MDRDRQTLAEHENTTLKDFDYTQTTEFWYLDQNDEMVQRYNREQAMTFLPRITDRATIMTSDQELRPKPSLQNCRWCPFKQNGSCEWRME